MSTDAEDQPAMEQNVASDADKVDGIVAQVRADLAGESPERIAAVLAQRLEQAGIALSHSDIDALARQ
ncbi:hypothetical protein ACFQRL_12215 [Microbacterium fluvii]|uniref:Uncharacterized protein n=1 Tax=Microbacterium fluvii TaxID=415215 RepID=A0ABW2HEN9_9MICO|nr:hypothetical protein [Microbacterium fluvii]MCU4673361.1 hypothetical protein [Microbacterium fluvii]